MVIFRHLTRTQPICPMVIFRHLTRTQTISPMVIFTDTMSIIILMHLTGTQTLCAMVIFRHLTMTQTMCLMVIFIHQDTGTTSYGNIHAPYKDRDSTSFANIRHLTRKQALLPMGILGTLPGHRYYFLW